MKKILLLLLLAFITLSPTLCYSQALPDSAFSVWTLNRNPRYYDPNPVPLTGNGWQDVNIVSSPLWGSSPVSCFRDSVNFNSAPYSAKIVAVALNTLTSGLLANDLGGRDTIGIMFLGTGQTLGWPFILGYPFTGRPLSLQFYYEFTPVNVDTAGAFVMLTKWNTTKLQEDTVAMGTMLFSTRVTTFTKATLNLTYTTKYFTSGNPDTAQVLFSATNLMNSHKAQPGSTLWVDDVKWSGVVTGTQNMNAVAETIVVYPNPANTKITFYFSDISANKVEVYDITGKEINTVTVLNRSQVLNTSTYNNGIYIYRVLDASGAVLKIGKFSIVK